jgi:hypothetical protein
MKKEKALLHSSFILLPFPRALPAALTISRDANPGGGQDFTGLVVAVQLRHRVAFGLQALQRCSGLLNRRARGSTVAAHHFRGRNPD